MGNSFQSNTNVQLLFHFRAQDNSALLLKPIPENSLDSEKQIP